MEARDKSITELCGGKLSHCIILAPSRDVPTPSLLAQLTGEGIHATVLDDPLAAMSKLALLDRLEATRAAWGLNETNPVGLVIDHSSMISDMDQMLAAIDKYLSNAWVLNYDVSNAKKWTVLHTSSVDTEVTHPLRRADAANQPVIEAINRRNIDPSGPRLRLVDSDIAPITPLEDKDTTESEDDSSPTVSRQELEMLLHDDNTSNAADNESESAKGAE